MKRPIRTFHCVIPEWIYDRIKGKLRQTEYWLASRIYSKKMLEDKEYCYLIKCPIEFVMTLDTILKEVLPCHNHASYVFKARVFCFGSPDDKKKP